MRIGHVLCQSSPKTIQYIAITFLLLILTFNNIERSHLKIHVLIPIQSLDLVTC